MPNINLWCFSILIFFSCTSADKKANNFLKEEPYFEQVKSETNDLDLRNLQSPFRIDKLNSIWSISKNRLTDPKLKSFYMELKQHDQRLKVDTQQKVLDIMRSYDLFKPYQERTDEKRLNPFKDNKLGRFWDKAENSGFTEEELDKLNIELRFHQIRVDSYHLILRQGIEAQMFIHKEKGSLNGISATANRHENDKPRDREHIDLKDHYDLLKRRILGEHSNQDFINPKVQALWQVAQASNFSDIEIYSFKTGLQRLQARFSKYAEDATQKEKLKNEKLVDKSNRFGEMEDTTKKQYRKKEKIQENIEKSVFKRIEL